MANFTYIDYFFALWPVNTLGGIFAYCVISARVYAEINPHSLATSRCVNKERVATQVTRSSSTSIMIIKYFETDLARQVVQYAVLQVSAILGRGRGTPGPAPRYSWRADGDLWEAGWKRAADINHRTWIALLSGRTRHCLLLLLINWLGGHYLRQGQVGGGGGGGVEM